MARRGASSAHSRPGTTVKMETTCRRLRFNTQPRMYREVLLTGRLLHLMNPPPSSCFVLWASPLLGMRQERALGHREKSRRGHHAYDPRQSPATGKSRYVPGCTILDLARDRVVELRVPAAHVRSASKARPPRPWHLRASLQYRNDARGTRRDLRVVPDPAYFRRATPNSSPSRSRPARVGDVSWAPRMGRALA
jgi:hypothetical protein